MPKETSTCNQKTFRQLFDQYAQELQNLIFYKSGNLSLAEDCVQEAFIRLWKNCSKVPVEKARNFLYKVCNNVFIDNARRQKTFFNYKNQLTKNVEFEDPEYLLRVKEFREKLMGAINALPEHQRTVFLMNRVDGMKYREIAAALDITQKAVEKRMQKALIEIRKITGRI